MDKIEKLTLVADKSPLWWRLPGSLESFFEKGLFVDKNIPRDQAISIAKAFIKKHGLGKDLPIKLVRMKINRKKLSVNYCIRNVFIMEALK
jgi:hypothetical protein